MTSTVTLPVWVVAIVALLAAVSLLDRLLLPSIRWALRTRANRAVAKLNTKLKLRIQPFKMTKRQVLIDQLMFDPDTLHAAEEYALANGVPRDVAMEKAKRYAREIVPSFNAYAYFRVGTRLARKVSETLYRVRLGYKNDEQLASVDPNSSVVFIINHRSNMDYVLVTYVAATQSALSYAVGEWAQIWGLRSLISSMGAYFIRRDSRDPLYRRILARYVHMATAAGVVQAVFPEGGLSRDGALREPKFGLLSYMVSGFDTQGLRDITFIPVGINYDRVLEDRILVGAASTEQGQKPQFRFSAGRLLGFIGGNIWRSLRGKNYRYGYACVSFGDPISLKGYLARENTDFRTLAPGPRFAAIEKLGRELMTAVGHVIPALPVSLVATALLDTREVALTAFELKARVAALIEHLEATGAHVHVPRADRDYAIDVGLRMLTLRHFVIEENETYRANPAERVMLVYYANAIAHLLPKHGVAANPTVRLFH
ncbi:MAG: 1-acyl-sn-glycerol-3-phosphate acyltransferase [Hyphomicrobiaceae bacterium]